MPKSRLTVALSLLFVFLSGAILGVLAQRAYTASRPASAASNPRRFGPAEWRKRYVAETRDRLKLDAKQTERLTAILGDVDEEIHQVQTKRRAEDQASPLGNQRRAEDQAIQAHLVARVNEMLQPAQRVLYQQLRDERDKARKQRGQEKKGIPPGPPAPTASH
jgi:hypothetical protein